MDADPDPSYHNMRIHADPDPQHCYDEIVIPFPILERLYVHRHRHSLFFLLFFLIFKVNSVTMALFLHFQASREFVLPLLLKMEIKWMVGTYAVSVP